MIRKLFISLSASLVFFVAGSASAQEPPPSSDVLYGAYYYCGYGGNHPASPQMVNCMCTFLSNYAAWAWQLAYSWWQVPDYALWATWDTHAESVNNYAQSWCSYTA